MPLFLVWYPSTVRGVTCVRYPLRPSTQGGVRP